MDGAGGGNQVTGYRHQGELFQDLNGVDVAHEEMWISRGIYWNFSDGSDYGELFRESTAANRRTPAGCLYPLKVSVFRGAVWRFWASDGREAAAHPFRLCSIGESFREHASGSPCRPDR